MLWILYQQDGHRTSRAAQVHPLTTAGANFQTVHTDCDLSLAESSPALASHWLENSMQFEKGRLQS